MDKDQQAKTDKLKERAVAVAPFIADFIQSLAEWGFNNVHHALLWEAMCALIESAEFGYLDEVIDAERDE